MAGNLPQDLIVDILSRLPMKSLLKFRCVSKSWCVLITDPAFVKIHLNQSLATNTNHTLIFRKDSACYSVDFDPDACEPPLNHPLKSLIFGPRAVLGSCNGLVCISNSLDDIYLWNPSTRSHLKLPFSPIKSSISYDSAYGFGYEPTSDDYKVVRAVDEFVIVYSLRTDSWRRIGKLPFSLFNNDWGRGVLVNSALHWVAKVRSIISFHLKDEEYREVPLPHFMDDDDFVDNKFLMKVGVLGGQLCLLCNYSNRVEIWVMKDYGKRDSWVKQFSNEKPSVVWQFYNYTPVCYSKKGGFILRRGRCWVSLILYDPHTGWTSNLGNRPGFDGIEICVGSLVHLMELNKKKRKKQIGDW